MYQLEISHNAHRQINKLQAATQERINSAIVRLADNPRPAGVKKLIAREGYRIRVGDYRILFTIDDEAQVVTIYRVMSRGEVYRS